MTVNWLNDEEFEEVKQKNEFDRLLEEADYEVRARHDYICEQLDYTAEQEIELAKVKECLKVELEIAERMNNKELIMQIKQQLKQADEAIEDFGLRYEILEDLWDDLFFGLLGLEKPQEKKVDNVIRLV